MSEEDKKISMDIAETVLRVGYGVSEDHLKVFGGLTNLLTTIPDVDILLNYYGADPDILIDERVSLFRVAVEDGDVETFVTGVVTDAKREDNGSTTVVIGGKLFVIGPDVFVILHEPK